MATLTAAISSSVTEFSVSGDVSAAKTGQEYRIDDEVIVLREFVRTKAERRGPRNRNRWSVSRGQAGTTAASHLIGAEIFALNEAVATGVSLSEPEPFAGTSSVAPVVQSTEDPGAIGAGNLWIRLDPSESYPPMLYVRNAADDGWVDDAASGFGLGMTWYTGADVAAWLGGSSFGITLEVVDPPTADRLSYWQVNPESIIGSSVGPISFIAGDGPGTDGGDLTISTTGEGVTLRFIAADGSPIRGISFSELSVVMTGLPTADPAIADALWIDTAAGRVLKVSAG